MKWKMRFGKKGKLTFRFVGPYKILKSIGKVSYELELPIKLAVVHPVYLYFFVEVCGLSNIHCAFRKYVYEG